MEIVLGISVSPAVVHLVLVEGADGSGATVDHDALGPSADLVSAVLGTQALAAAGGHRLAAVGITSAGSTLAQSTELADALTALGFTDVRVVPEQHATEALAQGLSVAAPSDSAAVLSIEPESATLAIVETRDGEVVKTVTRTLDGVDPGDGVTKLAAALDDPHAQAVDLFVVSAGVDVDDVKSYLDAALPMPVHAPAEPELALARGAALAAAANVDTPADDADEVRPSLFVPKAVRISAAAQGAVAVVDEPEAAPRPLDGLLRVRTLSSVLGASAVTFVVAVAIAVGMNSGTEPSMPQADRDPLPAAKVHQEVAPAAEQAPLPPEIPAPVIAAPPLQAPPAAGPPLPAPVIAAIGRLQQPVTLPPVPGISDQPITVPPLPSLINQLRP